MKRHAKPSERVPQRVFEKTPAYPKEWLVLGNLVNASLLGAKVTISEIESKGIISN